LLKEKLGQGSFSKVYRVGKLNSNKKEGEFKDDYAMKILHKPTLARARCVKYDSSKKA